MKYTIRKLLTLFVVLALFFGPGVFRGVRDIVAPSTEIKIARIVEAHEVNLDVVNVLSHDTNPDKILVVVQLDNRSYWSSNRIWTNLTSFILRVIGEHGYSDLTILSGWDEGRVNLMTTCENLRITDCVYDPLESPLTVVTPWLGKGKP